VLLQGEEVTKGPDPSNLDDILAEVAKKWNLPASGDRYPALLRVGDNWADYPFPWEPLRDLAGGQRSVDDAVPIVLVSTEPDNGTDGKPAVESFTTPYPFTEIHITPKTPLAALVDTWLDLLADRVASDGKPAPWFLEDLRLAPDDVSPHSLIFLGIESPSGPEPVRSTTSLSPTVQGIERDLGDEPVTAFGIAAALVDHHPEYASHRLGQTILTPIPNAARYPWEFWRDSVVNLYDLDAIAKSTHRGLDGRLLLVGLGLFDEPLRLVLDEQGVWAPLLLEFDEAAAGASGPVRDALNAIQLAHGYESDRVIGDDQLGIQGEVNAVCEVITDPAVDPPVAVGLFGAWGSGKSFFMEKMRERVYELTARSNVRRKGNVVQIRFNAWHYADTSLWASLAVEIFERLADPEPVDAGDRERWLKARGDPKKTQREALLANLETYREARAALDEERKRLEEERTELEQRRQESAKARNRLIDRTMLIDVGVELAKSESVRNGIEKIADVLEVKPTVDELGVLASELRTTSGYVANTWRLVKGKTWTIALLATFVVLLVVTAAAQLTTDGTWLRSLIPGIGSVAAAVTAGARFITPATKAVNQALIEVESTLQQAKEIEAGLRRERSKQEQKLELQLADHTQRIAETNRAISEIDERIATTQAEAQALTVGRRLYDFLADRAAGYQKHQGVVGMLHRDFRLLDAQLTSQPDADADMSGLPRIDRVVLYVDDLDRCPPVKVLEVLEAVHLLLALPLFIVVVGVDPAWLQRSLRHQYRELSLSREPESDPYLQTMPTQYLEKIFQIPLTLPGMGPDAYGRLIASLAPTTDAPAAPPSTPTTPSRRAASPESPGGTRAPTRALLEVQVGSAAHGQGEHTIDLTRDEVAFAQQLGGLVDTPRGAKRLMNIYRLIRATQHVGSRSRFLGADGEPGEYYAVLSLLAVAAGFPTLADRVLVALEQDADEQGVDSWSTFVEMLHLSDDGDSGGLVPSDLARPSERSDIVKAEVAEWSNMHTGLQESLENNPLEKLEPYQRWGRTVARFSFTP
jgi:hypothetical protein